MGMKKLSHDLQPDTRDSNMQHNLKTSADYLENLTGHLRALLRLDLDSMVTWTSLADVLGSITTGINCVLQDIEAVQAFVQEGAELEAEDEE
jgi:hypothetical protein